MPNKKPALLHDPAAQAASFNQGNALHLLFEFRPLKRRQNQDRKWAPGRQRTGRFLPGPLFDSGSGRDITVQAESSAEARRTVMEMFPGAVVTGVNRVK